MKSPSVQYAALLRVSGSPPQLTSPSSRYGMIWRIGSNCAPADVNWARQYCSAEETAPVRSRWNSSGSLVGRSVPPPPPKQAAATTRAVTKTATRAGREDARMDLLLSTGLVDDYP